MVAIAGENKKGPAMRNEGGKKGFCCALCQLAPLCGLRRYRSRWRPLADNLHRVARGGDDGKTRGGHCIQN